MPDAELRKVTVAYTIELAQVLRSRKPCCGLFLFKWQGRGPDGTKPAGFRRYKDEAEKTLLGVGNSRVYIFRPAYIYPVEPRKEPNFSYRVLRKIYPASGMLFPNQVIRADDLARAMVDVAVRKRGF